MADQPAPSDNPFDQIDPAMKAAPAVAPAAPAAPAPAAAPVPQDNAPAAESAPEAKPEANPFDDLGEVGATPVSTSGSFLRAAEREIIPSIGSLPAMGAGAEVGSLLGTPLGPYGKIGGAVIGGLAGGYFGHEGLAAAQNWAVHKLPDTWQEALEIDDRKKRLDEQQNPTASFLGGLAPMALTMNPTSVAKELPQNATALQTILSHQPLARAFGGAIMGGMELGNEALSGGDIDWRKVAIATVFGTVMHRPNKIGETITEAGARPVRSAKTAVAESLGIPHPGDQPTLAQAGDMKVMGPGVTESVFRGTEEQAPAAAQTAQEAARTEKSILEPPEPDIRGIAKQMHPELFDRMKGLEAQRATFERWLAEGINPPEVAQKHLDATLAQINELGGEISAAYRRAQETTGGPVVEAPQFKSFAEMLAARDKEIPNATIPKPPEAQPGGEPSVSVSGETPANVEGPGPAAVAGAPGPQRSIGEQRAAIADDVARRLMAAGRPADEAAAGGQLAAARVVARAQRFEGKLGTPEELHARESAAIAGPDGRALHPAEAVKAYQEAGERQGEAPAPAPAAPPEAAGAQFEPGIIAGDLPNAAKVKATWRKTAPFKEAEPFIQASWHNQRDMAATGEQIAKDIGVEFKNPGIKARTTDDIASIKDEKKRAVAQASRKRLEDKAAKHGVGGVTDQVRSGFEVQTPEQAEQAIAKLAEKYPLIDEGWQTTPSGYFDRKAYVRFPDGMIGEIQIWPPGMFEAKESRGGHALYEGVRELPPWHPLIPQFHQVTGDIYGRARAALSPDWNAALGKGGSLPNILPKASGVSTEPSSPTLAALTSDHLPSESTQASEGVQKNGSPSSEPAFSSDMGGSPTENIETGNLFGNHAEPVQAVLNASDRINALTPAEQKRELPKYSPDKEQPRGVDQPAGVFMFDPTALNVDASRFQFKSGGDEYGVTGALRNVTKWDPAKAQAIMVWEQNDGKLFVADGHQRAGLARRLTEKGSAKGIELPGILYREKDGISADDIRAMAAVTNIANGSGSALDGAKVLRARPDLMDGSLPLSVGKGKQAAALARLGDEPFKMVVNDVIPENYGAVVGDLIPNDPDRQAAAIKAIARFEPKNADEAAVLTQRVAQAELAKAEAGAQGSMFGDLETAESTAGEEMKIVGRAIADLKKDKGLFARVLANAERIEQTGSQIKREAAQSIASDAEVFAKTLTSDAYSAGPIRDELIAAARDLKNGNATLGETSTRIIAALRSQVEAHGLNGAGVGGEPVKEFAQNDLLDFEAGAEGKPQALIPGVAPVSQRDLIQAAANKPMQAKKPQKEAGGLFGDSMDQKELFQRDQQNTPEFKRWFKDSKVVDSTGNPLRVYHGMKGELEGGRFDPKRIGETWAADDRGFFFISDPKQASEYASGDTVGLSSAEPGAAVVPAYVSLKKPLVIDDAFLRTEGMAPIGKTEDVVSFWDNYQGQIHEWMDEKGSDGVILVDASGRGEPTRMVVALKPEQIKSATGNSGAFNPKDPRIFEQVARGKIRISPNERAVITLLKDANASTFVHESGHQYLEELMRDAEHEHAPMGLRDDAQTVRDWLGVKGTDEIKTKHHEKFARGFEQYVREGVAPSPELAGVFAKFRNWLLGIYQSIKGLGTEISPEIRGVFDRMLEMEPQRTVIAPEHIASDMLHDIHEAEAQHIPPHEAEGAADRITAETARAIEDQPPEIKRELETSIAKVQEAEAAAGGAAGGEAGGGAASERPLVEGGGGPGTEPGGGARGEEHSAEQPGGGDAVPEGAGADRPDPRSKLSDHPGAALAPGPADLFGARESPFTDRAGNIRLDTLNTSDDVKQALRDSAAENNDFIGDRRGVVTDGQVMELAYDIGMQGAERLVQQHVTGQAFNAEQVVALRKLLKESAGNVAAAAKKAADSGADADVLAYAQAKDRLQMVQKTVAGVTAEAGRALRAFRKLPGEADTTALEQMMKEATGKTLFQLKQEAKLAAQMDTPQKMNKFMQDTGQHSAGSMLFEFWVNGLLSGPATHVTNLMSNVLQSFGHFGPEKAIASLVGSAAHALGREGTYTRVGEIGAAVRGAKEGAAPALAATGEAFQKGASSLLPGEEGPAHGVLHGLIHDDLVPRGTLDESKTMRDVGAGLFATMRGTLDAIVSGGALLKAGGIEGAPFISAKYAAQGAIPDIQIKGMNVLPIGSAIRMPGRFLATMDTFSRSLNYSMAKNGIAYRMATDEGLAGDAFARRVADIRDNPTPEVMEQARDVATEQTFMDKAGGLAQRLNHLTSWEANIPGLGATRPLKFVAPFTNVVSRILDQTLVKRTPLGLLSKELQGDLLGKNGNIAQDTAAARMILGSTLLLGFGSLAAQGLITGSGPKDPRENAIWRLNNQAHSVKIGNTFYQVSKLGPMGMLMGMAADLHDVKHMVDQDKWAEAGGHLFHAIVQNVLDQSALQGPAEMIKAIETPEQYGPQFVKSFLSSFVPASGLAYSIARSQDPYIRQTWGIIDAMKAKIPGYSETLHPKIDIWGQPTPTREALIGTGITGVYMQRVTSDPVNKALVDLGIKMGSVDKKIRGVTLTPQQYEDFARIAGRMTKMRLDAIVPSSAFQNAPPFVKEKIISEAFKQSRESASAMVKMKNPQIANDAVKALKEKMAKK